MSGDTEDLLEFGTIDVYYIVWVRDDNTYYLQDTTSNLCHILWTTNRRDALYFYTESEAKKHYKAVRRTRPEVEWITDEIDVLEDLDVSL